jgi:hypothetical protein
MYVHHSTLEGLTVQCSSADRSCLALEDVDFCAWLEYIRRSVDGSN